MSHPRFGQAVWHINLVKRRFFATPDVTPLASISRRPNCGGFPATIADSGFSRLSPLR